jgi:hypothetical protein
MLNALIYRHTIDGADRVVSTLDNLAIPDYAVVQEHAANECKYEKQIDVAHPMDSDASDIFGRGRVEVDLSNGEVRARADVALTASRDQIVGMDQRFRIGRML